MMVDQSLLKKNLVTFINKDINHKENLRDRGNNSYLVTFFILLLHDVIHMKENSFFYQMYSNRITKDD